MATTNYVSMDGMLIGEITSGVMRNYGTDALGSVVETVLNGVEENTYAYKPYGATLAKTGTAADPSFLWNGVAGVRTSASLLNAACYLPSRQYSDLSATWTTVTTNWPNRAAYQFQKGNPVKESMRPIPFVPNKLTFTAQPKVSSGGCAGNVKCYCEGVWGLSNSNSTGLIVQKVTSVTSSFKISCLNTGPTKATTVFYEAWVVADGLIYCGAQFQGPVPGRDLHGIIGSGPAACLVATISASWVAYFFSGQTIPLFWIGSNWNETGNTNGLCSGPIPKWAGAGAPPFWNSPSTNSTTGSYTVSINCCNSPRNCNYNQSEVGCSTSC